MNKQETRKFLDEAYRAFIKNHFIDRGEEIPLTFSDTWDFYYKNSATEVLEVLGMFKKVASGNDVSLKKLHKEIRDGR